MARVLAPLIATLFLAPFRAVLAFALPARI